MTIKRRLSKKETSSQSIFFIVFLSILFVAIIGFLIISNLRVSKKRESFISQIESLKKEIQALEEKKEKLQAGIQESQSESFLEKEARERLNLKKPGEEVAAVLPPEEKKEVNPRELKEKNLWQKILDAIGF